MLSLSSQFKFSIEYIATWVNIPMRVWATFWRLDMIAYVHVHTWPLTFAHAHMWGHRTTVCRWTVCRGHVSAIKSTACMNLIHVIILKYLSIDLTNCGSSDNVFCNYSLALYFVSLFTSASYFKFILKQFYYLL